MSATSPNDTDTQPVVAEEQEEERAREKTPEVQEPNGPIKSSASPSSSSMNAALEKDLKKVSFSERFSCSQIAAIDLTYQSLN